MISCTFNVTVRKVTYLVKPKMTIVMMFWMILVLKFGFWDGVLNLVYLKIITSFLRSSVHVIC
jgi:hypothetical protein